MLADKHAAFCFKFSIKMHSRTADILLLWSHMHAASYGYEANDKLTVLNCIIYMEPDTKAGMHAQILTT